MDRTRLPSRLPIVVLVGWTLFVWLSRLRNVFVDDDLTMAGVIARVGVVVVFVALASIVVVALRGGRAPLGPAVRALAVWTILFWVVRGTAIAIDDHDAAFIAVHAVLMAVSIVLAAWAWSSLSAPRRAADVPSGPARLRSSWDSPSPS